MALPIGTIGTIASAGRGIELEMLVKKTEVIFLRGLVLIVMIAVLGFMYYRTQASPQ